VNVPVTAEADCRPNAALAQLNIIWRKFEGKYSYCIKAGSG
jgi:hypothetical protein